MRRVVLALLLILGLAPGTWFKEPRAPWNRTVTIRFAPVALPPKAEIVRHLGAFELEAAWAMSSRYSRFGGYSALLTQPGHRLLAISDSAHRLTFSPPGAPPSRVESGTLLSPRIRRDRDIEAATQDAATGTVWTAREESNAISRYDPGFGRLASVRPRAMRHWGDNSGPEAMVRLSDGRFIVLAEGSMGLFGSQRHEALLFDRDPLLGGRPVKFFYVGPSGFSPTSMAQLPDGRVLILMRRLVWPLPLRFTGRIVIADPAAIRRGGVWRGVEVAKLKPPLPVDNFEAMAIAPRADGRLTIWLMSDDNHADTQRTLLWKLALDPARLPDAKRAQAREKARK